MLLPWTLARHSTVSLTIFCWKSLDLKDWMKDHGPSFRVTSHCYQRVKLGNSFSLWNVIHSGVPQGSILGPLLFNIFMNNLAYAINESSLSFADDTNLHASNECPCAIENMTNQDLFNATSWCKQNGMIANPTKYNAMVLGNANQCGISIECAVKRFQYPRR